MKKRVVKFLVDHGLRRLAYHISPSLTQYYIGTRVAERLARAFEDAGNAMAGMTDTLAKFVNFLETEPTEEE